MLICTPGDFAVTFLGGLTFGVGLVSATLIAQWRRKRLAAEKARGSKLG